MPPRLLGDVERRPKGEMVAPLRLRQALLGFLPMAGEPPGVAPHHGTDASARVSRNTGGALSRRPGAPVRRRAGAGAAASISVRRVSGETTRR